MSLALVRKSFDVLGLSGVFSPDVLHCQRGVVQKFVRKAAGKLLAKEEGLGKEERKNESIKKIECALSLTKNHVNTIT